MKRLLARQMQRPHPQCRTSAALEEDQAPALEPAETAQPRAGRDVQLSRRRAGELEPRPELGEPQPVHCDLPIGKARRVLVQRIEPDLRHLDVAALEFGHSASSTNFQTRSHISWLPWRSSM